MKNTVKLQRLGYLFVVGGLISFWSSFVIMIEKLTLAADPSYIPPCSINPFISCGPVMESAQAAVFGFPNPLIGIAGFAIVATIGFAILAGATFKRWYWIGIQLGMTFAIGFIYWLFHAAVFDIGALCTYCMVVWTFTIPLFLYTTVYNIQKGYILTSIKGLQASIKTWHINTTLVLMYGVIIVSIAYRFWYSWLTMLGFL